MLFLGRDLEKNNLSGSVPIELVQKWNEGSLELRCAKTTKLIYESSVLHYSLPLT